MDLTERLADALADAGIVGARVDVRGPQPRLGNHGFPVEVRLDAHDALQLIDLLNERRAE